MNMLCDEIQIDINRLQPMVFEHAFRPDKVGQPQGYLQQELRECYLMGKGNLLTVVNEGGHDSELRGITWICASYLHRPPPPTPMNF